MAVFVLVDVLTGVLVAVGVSARIGVSVGTDVSVSVGVSVSTGAFGTVSSLMGVCAPAKWAANPKPKPSTPVTISTVTRAPIQNLLTCITDICDCSELLRNSYCLLLTAYCLLGKHLMQ